MANIEEFMRDPLLSLIDKVIEDGKEEPRDYLGASGIGDDCHRKLWYRLHGEPEAFDAGTLRLFQDGHRTEAVIVEWLSKIPSIELYTEAAGKQYGFADFNGKYKGHYDGVIKGIPKAPKTWHILEIKCTNEKQFKKLQKIIKEHGEKAALKEWRPEYYAQAMTYCWYEGLERHITIVSTPGARDLLTLRTNANNRYARQLRKKAQSIIEAKEPPKKIGGPDFYKCKYCSFYRKCHMEDK